MERKTANKSGKKGKKPNTSDRQKSDACEDPDRFQRLFGFQLTDLQSWRRFVCLMSRPTDPASLAFTRFIFADVRWGDPEQCHFPLFDWLQPLPVQWMIILYFLMLIGAAGIMLGAVYRVSCLLFLLPYWYILLLDKSVWNNHSYLFGILAFLLTLSDANRYWSVDGLFNRNIHNADVPLWNYTLLRSQVFLVYFVAGLKKLDIDWVTGYSMQYLASHWVFEPFRLVMTNDEVDYFVVHLGGLTIDLFIGFLFFFDKTRLLAFIFCSSFHLMNSQLFSIGMFPWVMLATQPLFCYANWPRPIFRRIPRAMRLLTPDDDDTDTQPSSHCIYPKEYVKPEMTPDVRTAAPASRQRTPPTRPSLRHQAAAIFSIIFLLWQMFLPYSHFITKGYNSWTQGLYGYSWDMMVHSRNLQHIRITFVDKDTGQQGYLNPELWTRSSRWGSHPDMMQQYARCIASNLRKHDVNNVELYFDVWISLNKRFQQRTVDPRVDVLHADWSPFRSTTWMMPLLVDLSDWRTKFTEITESLNNNTEFVEVVFVADFPGLHLENYVHPDIGYTNITVLKGKVVVEVLPEEEDQSVPSADNVTLLEGQSTQIPGGRFHNVYTVSDEPSCYMYIFTNTTEARFLEGLKEFELLMNGTEDTSKVPEKFAKDPNLDRYKEVLEAKAKERQYAEKKLSEMAKDVVQFIHSRTVRSFRMIKGAMKSIVMSIPFHSILEEINTSENEQSFSTPVL
ncbi:hypothetical protein BaRGS_00015477 [Batillaria attramentaria]|uniref:Vitamin K-dependent gamma-carboxylase n=1 Tax=Batillaria attramentaria TaxID=370345 RepID=A0ABD0L1Y9_9CAEN